MITEHKQGRTHLWVEFRDDFGEVVQASTEVLGNGLELRQVARVLANERGHLIDIVECAESLDSKTGEVIHTRETWFATAHPTEVG